MDEGAEADDEAPPITGKQGDEDAKWWESWRKQLRSEAGGLKGRKRRKLTRRARPDEVDSDTEMDIPAERPKALEEFKVDESRLRDDMRITVKVSVCPSLRDVCVEVISYQVDIIVGSMKLEDQFEWDVEGSSITPEDFAEVYAQDLGLAGEFK